MMRCILVLDNQRERAGWRTDRLGSGGSELTQAGTAGLCL
jgi:hypothetical protein